VCQKVARLSVFDLVRCSVKVVVGVVQSRGQGLAFAVQYRRVELGNLKGR
jgi:hypothetical protein